MQSTKLLLKAEHFPFIQCIARRISNQFIPKHEPAQPEDIQKLENFLRDKQNVLVLSGAGISTESGALKKIALIQNKLKFHLQKFTFFGK